MFQKPVPRHCYPRSECTHETQNESRQHGTYSAHPKPPERIDSVGGLGFINPAQIIRAVHLVPVFHRGRATNLLAPPAIRQKVFIDEWKPRVPIGNMYDSDLEDSNNEAASTAHEASIDPSEHHQGVEGEQGIEDVFEDVFELGEDWRYFYVNI